MSIARPLRVLLIEDSEDDAALLVREVSRGGFLVTTDRVQDESGLRRALDEGTYDIVIADYVLPGFSGLTALRIVRERDADLPFVLVSGTIGDDVAVDAIRSGASDYVLKDRLTRLVPTIERELRASADRRAHRRLEDQLRHSQKMEAVGHLAGGIAHDFNNLLTAILGYTELALDSVDDPAKVAADLAEIRKTGQRAAALSKQLLAFSRRSVVTPEVIDVVALVNDLTPTLRQLIGDDVRLLAGDEGSAHRVLINPGQMEQVIVKLVVNARDAMPEGGTLTIRTTLVTVHAADIRDQPDRAPGTYVRTSVIDTGEGMTPETLKRLFEPFFTTKEAGKGIGLGLSTVYGIVRHHGGHISVSSTRGEGTRFDVDLPLASAAKPAVAVPSAHFPRT